MKMVDKNGLKISSTLFEFVNNEVIPSTNIKIEAFWSNFSKIVHELALLINLWFKKEKISKKK